MDINEESVVYEEIEVKEDLLENIENQIQEIYKFNIVDHDVKFYGLCENCRK